MKVICINDSNRPSDHPLSKWVIKDNIYTVIEAHKLGLMGGALGVQLEEIDLTGERCTYFLASRFKPVSESPEGFEEAMKDLITEDNLV